MKSSRFIAARHLIGKTQQEFAEEIGMNLDLFARSEESPQTHFNDSIGEKIKNKFAEQGVKFYGDESEGVIYYNFNE